MAAAPQAKRTVNISGGLHVSCDAVPSDALTKGTTPPTGTLLAGQPTTSPGAEKSQPPLSDSMFRFGTGRSADFTFSVPDTSTYSAVGSRRDSGGFGTPVEESSWWRAKDEHDKEWWIDRAWSDPVKFGLREGVLQERKRQFEPRLSVDLKYDLLGYELAEMNRASAAQMAKRKIAPMRGRRQPLGQGVQDTSPSEKRENGGIADIDEEGEPLLAKRRKFSETDG